MPPFTTRHSCTTGPTLSGSTRLRLAGQGYRRGDRTHRRSRRACSGVSLQATAVLIPDAMAAMALSTSPLFRPAHGSRPRVPRRVHTAAFNEGCVATPSHILIRSLTIDTRLDPGIDDPRSRANASATYWPTSSFTRSSSATVIPRLRGFQVARRGHGELGDQSRLPRRSGRAARTRQGTCMSNTGSRFDQGYSDDKGQTNGYCDYVFLQYLAGKFGNTTVKEMWDATTQAESIAAVRAALSNHGGLADVWHRFAWRPGTTTRRASRRISLTSTVSPPASRRHSTSRGKMYQIQSQLKWRLPRAHRSNRSI